MNERIKDLAKQAFITERVSKDLNYKESVSTEIIVSQMQGVFEKFAELLLAEVSQHLTNRGLDHAREVIEKEFGI